MKFLRILKFLIIIIIIVFGSIFSYTTYQNSWTTVISLECKWSTTSTGKSNVIEWYQIKKKVEDDLPSGFFRGTHLLSSMTDKEIYNQYDRLWKYGQTSYTFADYDKTIKNPNFGNFDQFGNQDTKEYIYGVPPATYHTLNRINLSMSYTKNGDTTYAKCKEISDREFYKKIREQINVKNEKYKL